MRVTEPARSIELLVLDDDTIVRHGLVQLAAQQPWIKRCRTAASLDAALGLLARAPADVAVVCLWFGSAGGTQAIGELRRRLAPLRIVVLSRHDDASHCERAFEAGAQGFVSMDDTTGQLIAAIARVADGGTYIGQRTQRDVVARITRRAAPTPETLIGRLTPREREILELIGAGLSSSEVAFKLTRSVKTIQAHKARLRERLGLRNEQQLLQFAARWVQSDEPI